MGAPATGLPRVRGRGRSGGPPDPGERERARSRRPITPAEAPALAAVGARLAALRAAAGLSQRALAARVEMRRESVHALEHGRRRPRASTLERVARVLAPELGRLPGEVAGELADLAGPGLAPESEHADRVNRRAERRRGRRRRRELSQAERDRLDAEIGRAQARLDRRLGERAGVLTCVFCQCPSVERVHGGRAGVCAACTAVLAEASAAGVPPRDWPRLLAERRSLDLARVTAAAHTLRSPP
jgi:transcriptional regulator with XRE-family HTH domain